MDTTAERGTRDEGGRAAPLADAGPSARDAGALEVRLLGPLRVLRGGREVPLPASRKARGLLAYLVMAPRPVHRSRLCEIFWDMPNDPRGELRWCLSKLRGVLDEGGHRRVRADRDFVSVDTAAVAVDALAVERGLDGTLAAGDAEALDRLAVVLDGGFLQGLTAERTPLFEAWLLARRDQCRGWHRLALDRLGPLLVPGDRRLAVLRRRIELQPDDPACHRDLLLALAAAGRAAEGEAHLGLASRLLASYGVDPAPLEREWPAMRRARPAAPPVGGPTHNLPPLLTSYVGRSDEGREVGARLAAHRVVTLVGPGGAGKTRLALAVGRGLVGDRAGGVWFVALAALDDPRLVGETLCSGMGIPVPDGRPAVDSAVGYLRDRSALVILDNCEHLIDAAAEVVGRLVEACPEVRVLATSRERLNVPGESLYPVPGLGLPPPGPATAAAARAHDACRLLEERAAALMAGFALSDDDADAVVDICRQLDGSPLAIELAVPLLRMVPPRHLAERLHDRALMAMDGGRGASPRHRTFLALFDWSYNLLDAAERGFLRRLAVFNGGWSPDMAAGVAGLDADAAFAVLTRLVEKSLVVADLRGAAPRYRLLRTIRGCALAKAAEAGEAPPRDRLAATMLAVLREADQTWATTPTEIWLERCQPDLDNLRAALDWAFGDGGERALGVELCAYSRRIWEDLALLPERERWFTAAFAQAGPSTPAPAMARLWLGQVCNGAHGDRADFAPALRAADLFGLCGDRLGRGEALAAAGAALQTPTTTGEARPYLEEALGILASLGPNKPLARCLRSLSMACHFEGDHGRARPLLARSEGVARAVGDLRGIASAQLAAAELSFAAGEPARAASEVEALLSGRHGNRRHTALGLANLAAYLLALDRVAEAHAVALRALEEAQALSWRANVIRTVEHIALVAALGGEHEAAAGLLGHCAAFYAAGTATRDVTELASHDRLRDILAGSLEPARLASATAEGALWTLDQAVGRARTAVVPP